MDIVPTEHKFSPDPKPKRLNPKQKKTIELYFSPNSETYANLYQSALKAGFRPTYALNLANRKPLWLSETVESTRELTQKHITKGIEHIATKEHINSRSPDDTRLNALTQLGKWAGLDKTDTTNITIVQPILGGATDTRKQVETTQTPHTTDTDNPKDNQ